MFFKQIISASYTDTPNRRFLWSAITGSSSSFFKRTMESDVSRSPTPSSVPTSDNVVVSFCNTSDLFVLLEWSSKQKSPKPKLSNLFLTTESAACFSATKSTVLPSCKAFAIIFVIVWLFPVPGGPCKTKVLPVCESATASHCVVSAVKGVKVVMGEVWSSQIFSSPPSLISERLWSKDAINSFFANSSILLRRSCHIW